jgi:hypothetical protein
MSEANTEEKLSNYSSDLFSTCMDLWYDYTNLCSSIYAEFIRNTSEIIKYWLDSFSKFWPRQYIDKVKVE